MFTASDIYGGNASAQPDPMAAATGAPNPPGTGEPKARTLARANPGITGNPTFLLVALLGLAAILVNFSVNVKVSG